MAKAKHTTKINPAAVMRRAWEIFRSAWGDCPNALTNRRKESFGSCLRLAWDDAKRTAKLAALDPVSARIDYLQSAIAIEEMSDCWSLARSNIAHMRAEISTLNSARGEAHGKKQKAERTFADEGNDKHRKAAKAHPDHKLIAACVDYAYTMGAASYAFRVDPTDADFASPIDSQNIEKARGLLSQIAGLNAKTVSGLFAKAQLVVVMKDIRIFDTLTEDELPMILSLAKDVCRLHKEGGGKHKKSLTQQPFGGIAQ